MTAPSVRADQLSALLARVEAAEGPDRELDARIEAATSPWPEDNTLTFISGSPTFRVHRGSAVALDNARGEYTASLDAALALCERVLPGWLRDVRELPSGNWIAFVSTYEPARLFDATCRSPPIALLSAMLRALLNTKENS